MAMAKQRIRSSDLQGLKYFRLIGDLLERLSNVGSERDRAGNRQLHCDQYVSLLLLYFFSPAVTSLRGLQQAAGLEKVQKLLGSKRVSLGSLSEAGSVFDPELAGLIIQELAMEALPLLPPADARALQNLTAVDGSYFKSIAHTAWALWSPGQPKAKLHLHFSVFDAVPRQAQVTPGKCSETDVLRNTLESGRLYVADRGYQDYQLFRDILDAGSSFIVRVKENIAYQTQETRELSQPAVQAGVIRDMLVSRIGTDHHKDEVKQTLRIVVVSTADRAGKPTELWLITDLLDVPAETIALGYRYRWTIELFFRWFKRILGARHLISTKENGITMQLYAGLIASLLIVLWTGLKANKRTWEMLQFYLTGWATLDELEDHIAKQKQRQEAQAAKKQK
jgi:hypothetical protein